MARLTQIPPKRIFFRQNLRKLTGGFLSAPLGGLKRIWTHLNMGYKTMQICTNLLLWTSKVRSLPMKRVVFLPVLTMESMTGWTDHNRRPLHPVWDWPSILRHCPVVFHWQKGQVGNDGTCVNGLFFCDRLWLEKDVEMLKATKKNWFV